jgi:hypothetical protein
MLCVFIHLIFVAIVSEDPECRVDEDCSDLFCIDERCQNPCIILNPCKGNEECSIQTPVYGKPVTACSCPEGFVASDNGYCIKGNTCFLISRHFLFLCHF